VWYVGHARDESNREEVGFVEATRRRLSSELIDPAPARIEGERIGAGFVVPVR